ncbi:MAG: ParB-like protein partition protein [Parcubacteria group bacterium Gr01-1014_48]|nr:MAG: ParB-like protein partition protein [Parcubacteria group bacterium Greene0416_14]TSC74546.1 MAG: ParB-like protein partition protein [Parcubacteria group bacterium Gr01-1014_48]TSD01422.1 MAG: ParB-like protein partition protein [Parcubacteria group bacterium Greene1014_15]TSD08436.1 MAG: ParB-like protein partition protein [Parcubacteria group bacterium Greene0714_4]
MAQQFQNDAIFWVEVDKVTPNPYQPRRDFDPDRLNDLAESIRMYGILQPLVVTRHESTTEEGGITVSYELIAGERRLRASKMAGIAHIPVMIRSGEENDQMKLELAIIENLQREDLNAIDRSKAFDRLVSEFHFSHTQVAKKIGKSREYVSNSLRLLGLSEEIKNAVSQGKVSEGHARALLMLSDREEEQMTLYKEILFKQLTVREAESIARRIATDRVRKKDRGYNPEIIELEKRLAESLGTRVQIEQREVGGKLVIDFFSNEDLHKILELIHTNELKDPDLLLKNYMEEQLRKQPVVAEARQVEIEDSSGDATEKAALVSEMMGGDPLAVDSDDGDNIEELAPSDLPAEQEHISEEEERMPPPRETIVEDKIEEENLYSVRNFSI